MDITKSDNQDGTSTWTFTDGTIQIRCNSCNNWHHASNGSIKHNKRCDTPSAQHARSTTPVTPNTCPPRTANGLSSEELVSAVQRKDLTTNEAMNRDF